MELFNQLIILCMTANPKPFPEFSKFIMFQFGDSIFYFGSPAYKMIL